ncbi:kunitz-type protease inhibitor 1 isoform X5 [Balaenoptera musculus]|uniref:Kunitz-type protease inhibitor 1 n=1 Tax=Balaenoptera musculus TaxID=9771 RepID=A0A8B8WV14_BALMU|nr:kunitz-type protease inhibitor 1 isoform X5 [Balaenoptera musculus]
MTPVGRRATVPGGMMAGARLSQALIPAVAVWLLCALGLLGTEAGPPPVPPSLLTADNCLDRFTPGVPAFVLDTDASVRNGATFLRSLTVRRGRDCVHACCSSNDCNLALVELQPDGGEAAIASCFLINCLYEQNFVCKFAPREGFINYLTREVYRSYRELRTQGFGEYCLASSKVGRCRGSFPRWYYNPTEQICKSFVYGGCLGNKNNYLREEECKLACRNVQGPSVERHHPGGLCSCPYSPHPCQLSNLSQVQAPDHTALAHQPIPTIRMKAHECPSPCSPGSSCQLLPILCVGGYKGQGWKGNRGCVMMPPWGREGQVDDGLLVFAGLCLSLTSPSTPSRPHPVCSGTCHSSKFRCSDGCCIDSFLECDDTPDCPDASDEAACEKYTRGFDKLQRIHFPADKGHCVDLPDTGLCLESIPRWYYNPFTERCARFTYGGCYGNKNNFEGEEQCLESCRGISKKDVFGLRRESPIPNTGSVEVAIAVLLGTCIVVVVTILGYCFFKHQRKGFHRHRHHHPPPSTPTSTKVSTTEDMEHLVYYQTTRPL